MASNVPIIRQFSLLFLVSQLILVWLFVYLFHLVGIEEPFILGILTYSVLAFVLKNLIAKKHRQGIKLVKQKKITDALPYFEKSVEYFSKNKWVDKYRFLTLLSSSKMTYKEMGFAILHFATAKQGLGRKRKNIMKRY